MKLLLLDGKIKLSQAQEFQFVNVDKKSNLSEPIRITRGELIAKLSAGESFHTLQRDGCTWQSGPKLQLTDLLEK